MPNVLIQNTEVRTSNAEPQTEHWSQSSVELIVKLQCGKSRSRRSVSVWAALKPAKRGRFAYFDFSLSHPHPMLFVIITVREAVFPESHCWALEECTMQALRSAGWSAEPWVQKVVRLPPAEFIYHCGANHAASVADPPNFVLVEVLLPQPKPAAEKKAFWAQFHPASKPDFIHWMRTSAFALPRCRAKTSTSTPRCHRLDGAAYNETWRTWRRQAHALGGDELDPRLRCS